MSAKPFKVTSFNVKKRYGIVARSLPELLQKGCQKLKLPQSGCRVCLFEDGTEIDEDYFFTLNNHCELIILEKGQQWNGELRYCLNKILDTFSENNEELTKVANQVLSDKKSIEFVQKFIQNSAENIAAESREDDPNWFEGLPSRYKTKSNYMRSTCASRMRNYLKEVQNSGIELEGIMANMYNAFVEKIKARLVQNKFNQSYFDRTAKEGIQLCDNQGYFTCQGPFDDSYCRFNHLINPYSNKENRIIFSTWNLDHRIEKKRTIIPAIIKAVPNQNNEDDQAEMFYKWLFTVENLKLVHIVCHKKCKHNLQL